MAAASALTRDELAARSREILGAWDVESLKKDQKL